MKTYLGGERLLIRSWARAQMDMTTLARLNRRAYDLGVRGGVLKEKAIWRASVHSENHRAEATGVTAEAALDRAMNLWEDDAWTAEELLTVANQSGIEVRRG